MAAIAALLRGGRLDAAAVEAIYAEGRHAAAADGSVRALRSLATAGRDEPIWNDYVAFYGDRAWLDTFVTQALEGTGPFEGAVGEVRAAAIRRGLQDGVMVASVLHELIAAEEQVAAGELDPVDGAPRHVDEARALYRGDEPAGAPFATAARRDSDAVLAQMTAARTAAAAGDAGALKAADDEVIRRIVIAYLRAALADAAEADAALAAGDRDAARVEQAEGLARLRVIAPLVARVDEAAARAALDAFDIAAGPRKGMGQVVATALESTYGGLGIRPAEIGTPGK